MRRPGRRLSADEAALWARVAETVKPLRDAPVPLRDGEGDQPQAGGGGTPSGNPLQPRAKLKTPSTTRFAGAPAPRSGEERALDRQHLDSTWDRRLSRGVVQPDFTLDLHGHTVDAAHARLDHGLALALAQGARVLLLVTGRERPSEDRRGRGVIRRKFLDWLAAGPHASRIAAIRPAHPRHGGAGAVYVVLKRVR